MKYMFTGKTKTIHDGEKPIQLKQIVCVTAFGDVEAGEVGGWIESVYNLSQIERCWVADNACVYDHGRVHGSATVYQNAQVCGLASISGRAEVLGNAYVSGSTRLILGHFTSRDVCPLQIQGSYHEIYSPDFKHIRIGCQEHSVEHWLKHFHNIGKSNGYTSEQIDEYKAYIDLFANVINAYQAKQNSN